MKLGWKARESSWDPPDLGLESFGSLACLFWDGSVLEKGCGDCRWIVSRQGERLCDGLRLLKELSEGVGGYLAEWVCGYVEVLPSAKSTHLTT